MSSVTVAEISSIGSFRRANYHLDVLQQQILIVKFYERCIYSILERAIVTIFSMPGVMELFSLQGRTALITGATRGIGQALAIALAETGADVVLIQRDFSNQATKQEIEKLGRKASIYQADLADREQLHDLVKRVLADGHDIDILVNCGGIQRRHPAHQFPDNDWDEVRVPSIRQP